MSIEAIKCINGEKSNRIEFILKNFDYYDGSDLIAKIFVEEYSMEAEKKIDGIWYTIIRLHNEEDEYNLIWHEDVGNYMYSCNQNKNAVEKLEQRLLPVVDKINFMLGEKR